MIQSNNWCLIIIMIKRKREYGQDMCVDDRSPCKYLFLWMKKKDEEYGLGIQHPTTPGSWTGKIGSGVGNVSRIYGWKSSHIFGKCVVSI